MRVVRFFLVFPLLCVLGGCFVLDELDWGMAELEKHPVKPGASSSRTAKKTTKPPTPSAPSGDSSWEDKVPDLRQWWSEARTLSSSKKDESIVQCRMDGRTQFMQIDECQARGGQVGG